MKRWASARSPAGLCYAGSQGPTHRPHNHENSRIEWGPPCRSACPPPLEFISCGVRPGNVEDLDWRAIALPREAAPAPRKSNASRGAAHRKERQYRYPGA